MSLDLLMGYAGMVSFGHSAFFGVGGYVAALALAKSPGLARRRSLLPAAGRRRRRARHRLLLDPGERRVLHHAHARLLADVLRRHLPGRVARRRGRDRRRPAPGAASGSTSARPCAFTLYLVGRRRRSPRSSSWRVVRSPFGHVLRGIHDNEARMEAVGYAVERYKLLAFVVGGHRRRASPARSTRSSSARSRRTPSCGRPRARRCSW